MALSPGQQLLRFIGRMRWLRGRDRVLRAFSHPDNRTSFPFVVPFYGQSYSGDLANFIDWNVFYYGAFAPHELELLGTVADALRRMGKPVNFFDVGANIGHHTLFMSGHADHVYSFEPFAVVRDEMARKLKYANAHNVSIFPVGLGDSQGSHVFHAPTGSNQGTGTLGDVLPDNASSDSILVEVARGDEFFRQNYLPPISLLKMDIEGYEVKALAGMRETLWRDRPPILMEIQRDHRSGTEKDKEVLELLYPDHTIFEVHESRGAYLLKPFVTGSSEEVLVLPSALSGIVRNGRVAAR